MSARFRRDIEALPEVFDLAAQFLSSQQLDSELRFAVDFALEEVFTNFVKYNPGGVSDIGVSLRIEDDQLKLVLTDFDSPRFDPNSDAPVVDINKPLAERKPGGLGVHLVKTMMDRVEYGHEERTSTITLYKRLRGTCST
ncbi:MAG TPA: ATP-binding protein [Thermoanaerobaculia bacterium]